MKNVSNAELLSLADPEIRGPLGSLMGKVAGRGGGIAIYTNQEIGNPEAGHMQFVTFGHPDAQLEDENPPECLPDIGGAINWRYTLTHVWQSAKENND